MNIGRKPAILLIVCALAAIGGAGLYGAPQPMASAANPAPAGPVARKHQSPPRVVSRVRTQEKVLALTFDDGPDPKYTPAVLAFARAKGVKLTFFVVGKQVQSYPELAKQEAAEGHAVGNHTWDHHIMTELSQRQEVSEIQRCDDVLDRICGQHALLMRPPKGLWDEHTPRAAAALGYAVVLWSVELEHHPRRSAQQLAQRVIGLARPGMIILAHDGEADRPTDRTKTMQALPILVDGLRQKGYRFVTVPELMAIAATGSASPSR